MNTGTDSSKRNPWIVLAVDDTVMPLSILQFAAAQSRASILIHSVRDGAEAIAYLKGTGPYANRQENPFPHLVLLDLKMPGIDGHSVLKWIREKPELKRLQVVVWSAFPLPGVEDEVREGGANCFVQKPRHMDDFNQLIKTITEVLIAARISPEQVSPGLGPSDKP